ncbi:MAG: hypothetical protein KBS67_06205 [Bacteroidales bacterium]|nr:hypothetical protein [Candidatus Cryptobacteroides equifaecalis]
MKRLIPAFIALLSMMSCTKTGAELYRGYYSFKTGGHIVIEGRYEPVVGEAKDTTLVRQLTPEWGQMRVMDNGDNNLKLTMNITAGSPVVFDAVVNNDILTLKPVTRRVGLDYGEGMFTVSGSGKRYEKTIILDLDCQGDYNYQGIHGKVKESHVSCIATENE